MWFPICPNPESSLGFKTSITELSISNCEERCPWLRGTPSTRSTHHCIEPTTSMAMQNINHLKPCHDIIDLISFLQNRRSHHTGGLLKVAADALCEYGNGQVTSSCTRTPKGFHTDFWEGPCHHDLYFLLFLWSEWWWFLQKARPFKHFHQWVQQLSDRCSTRKLLHFLFPTAHSEQLWGVTFVVQFSTLWNPLTKHLHLHIWHITSIHCRSSSGVGQAE